MATVLLANPNAEVVTRDERRWIIAGTHRRELRTAIERGAPFAAVKALHDSLPGEGTVVVLSERAAEPTVQAHRGITSAYEVFYCLDSSGEPVVTDLFRNALARLEPADRTVPDRARPRTCSIGRRRSTPTSSGSTGSVTARRSPGRPARRRPEPN